MAESAKVTAKSMAGISPTPTTANVEPDRKHKYPTPIAKKRSFNLDGRTSDLSTLHFASHWMIDPFANTE